MYTITSRPVQLFFTFLSAQNNSPMRNLCGIPADYIRVTEVSHIYYTFTCVDSFRKDTNNTYFFQVL